MTSSTARILRAANESVVSGQGSATTQLPRLIDRFGTQRIAVITTPSVERSDLLGRVTDALGDRVCATFAGSKAHTPGPVVVEGARVASEAGADGLVSLGGSSVVDLTKGIAMVLAEGEDLPGLRLGSGHPLSSPKLPHIAIPTTLSAAEFTSAAGITNPDTRVKEIYIHDSLAPRSVILDAEMTVSTPHQLWVGSGMKLVADCIEGVLSERATLYTDALLLSALEILLTDLPAPADDLDARGRCLQAGHMALSNLHNVGIGAVAALRHQLGGGSGVAHGEASTIVLPHVLRWNGDVATSTLDRIATRLDLPDAEGLIARIEETVNQLGLPTTLRDVGVNESDLDAIAEHAASERAAKINIRPADAAGLRSILSDAW